MNKLIIGFGTGALYKNLENSQTVSKQAIDLIKSTGCNGIEIFAGFLERLLFLNNLTEEDFAGFDYVSLHAPDDIEYDDSPKTKEILGIICAAHKRIKFNAIIIHGANIISTYWLEKFDLPYLIENVDYKKRDGRTLEEMKHIFKKFDRSMNLDVLHAYTITRDNSLALAMAHEFKDKIRQVHLSGLRIHDLDKQHHYPINETQQEDILASIPENVPIIIESVFPAYDSQELLIKNLKIEYLYVKSYVIKKFRN